VTAPLTTLVNGVRGGAVPGGDRAGQYGDGLFETITCIAGAPRWLALHWQRLVRGCEQLELALPPLATLEQEVRALAAPHAACIVKLVYSRQGATRGYGYEARSACNRTLSVFAWQGPQPARPEYRCAIGQLRLGENERLAGLKHLNRLEQVLAAGECRRRGLDDLLLATCSGYLTGSVQGNVFLRLDSGWVTPDLATAGVAGVTRARVLRRAGVAGASIDVRPVLLAELATLHSMSVCNVRTGLQQVTMLDQRPLAADPGFMALLEGSDES
jgi:4-amino-4-deoxychorismate lyase